MKKLQQVTVNIDKVLKIGGAIGGVLMLFFGISLATVINNVGEALKSPEKLKAHNERILVLEEEAHHIGDVREMDWELMRLMTDNYDSTDLYYFADDDGSVFDVDIRETAEGVKLAFVFKMYIVYPISIDTNGRMYIMLHHSREQNTYLFKKSEE